MIRQSLKIPKHFFEHQNDRWNQNGISDKTELWQPEVKTLDDASAHSKIFEIVVNDG